MGGLSKRDYTTALPPKSFINVEDFSSVVDLAQYIIFLGNNQAEYNKYHRWRTDYHGNHNIHYTLYHGYYVPIATMAPI